MKKFVRVSGICLAVSYVFLHVFKDFFLTYKEIGSVLVILGTLSGIFFAIGMFVFWFRSSFVHWFWKIIWLAVLLFSYYMIGPIIFYLLVYEMKKTLTPPKA